MTEHDFATPPGEVVDAGAMTIDFGKISSEFPVRPEAIYDATSDEISLEHTDGDPTKPYLKWVFSMPETTVGDKVFPKSNAWLNTSLQPQSLWRVKKVFEAFGIDVGGNVNIAEAMAKCRGAACKLWLGVKVYEGKERNEVLDVLSAVGAMAPGA